MTAQFARLMRACGRSLDERGAVGFKGTWKFGALGDLVEGLTQGSSNQWFTAFPLGDANHRREPNTCGLRNYFADLDHDKTNAPHATRAITDALGVEPCAIVDTGGGWHVYWRAEPRDWPSNREDTRLLVKRWVYGFGALAQEHGSDQIHDLSRVLRVPGFLNRSHKPGRAKAGEPVKLIWTNSRPEPVRLANFARWIPERVAVAPDVSGGLPPMPGEPDELMECAVLWTGVVSHSAVRKLCLEIADAHVEGHPGGDWARKNVIQRHASYVGNASEAARVVNRSLAGAIERARQKQAS